MEDTRCCGTGTCIINDDGVCWCGQKWDGTKMCFPERTDHNLGAADETAALEPVRQPSHPSSVET